MTNSISDLPTGFNLTEDSSIFTSKNPHCGRLREASQDRLQMSGRYFERLDQNLQNSKVQSP